MASGDFNTSCSCCVPGCNCGTAWKITTEQKPNECDPTDHSFAQLDHFSWDGKDADSNYLYCQKCGTIKTIRIFD